MGTFQILKKITVQFESLTMTILWEHCCPIAGGKKGAVEELSCGSLILFIDCERNSNWSKNFVLAEINLSERYKGQVSH